MLKHGTNLNDLFGISGWEIKSYSFDSEIQVTFHLERKAGHHYECGGCKTKLLFCYDHYNKRRVRDLSIWGYRTILEFSQVRVSCPECKKIESEHLDWVESYQRQTVRYEKYLASLCDYMPVMDIVEIEGVNKNLLYYNFLLLIGFLNTMVCISLKHICGMTKTLQSHHLVQSPWFM